MLSCIRGPLAEIPDPAERTSHLLGALITFFVAEFKKHNKVNIVYNTNFWVCFAAIYN